MTRQTNINEAKLKEENNQWETHWTFLRSWLEEMCDTDNTVATKYSITTHAKVMAVMDTLRPHTDENVDIQISNEQGDEKPLMNNAMIKQIIHANDLAIDAVKRLREVNDELQGDLEQFIERSAEDEAGLKDELEATEAEVKRLLCVIEDIESMIPDNHEEVSPILSDILNECHGVLPMFNEVSE